MKNFIDTNIALGYSLPCDKWHSNSIEFIFNNNNFYWSNNVKKEFNEKFKNITRGVFEFLGKISVLLAMNKKSFVNYYSFENFILNKTKNCNIDKTKKIKIIEFFWENKKIILSDFPIEIQLKFDSFILSYKFDYDSLKKELESIMNLHDCGLENYLKYSLIHEKLKDLKIHYPDDIILLDAHDLGLSSNVCFNTLDKELHVKIKNSNILKINEFKLLS